MAKKKYTVLRKPLTERQIVQAIKNSVPVDGYISAVIAVDVSEIVDAGGLEGFLDLISNRLTGSDLLMDADYDVVGHKGDELHFRVSGDASGIVETLGSEE